MYGSLIPFRALDLIFSHRKLLLLSIAPILLAFLFLTGGAVAFIYLAQSWVEATFHTWVEGASGVLLKLAVLLVSFVSIYFILQWVSFIISLVASPFNELLAERTEFILGVRIEKASLGKLTRVFFLDLRKTLISLILLSIFSIGLLIPAFNVAFFLALALLTTFTYITYPQNRRENGIRESVKWISQNLAASLGFGIVTSFLFVSPIINIFILPVAVVGGTMLYFRK